ncbi:MAG: hypothetical protein QNI99_19450 [Woeseiaceae bacterium]|nr:hypothetical protein [Woeseiaceae bacterium]
MRSCDYCGGQGTYKSGISFVTGEVFYSNCPKCGGSGFISSYIPDTRPLSTSEKRELGEKHMRENIEHGTNTKIISTGISICPDAFRR